MTRPINPWVRAMRLSVVVALSTVVLGACTPEAPGFVAVGRSEDGALVAGLIVCDRAPDRASLRRTSKLETDVPSDAEWDLDRDALRPGALVTWPLFGPTHDSVVESVKQATENAIDGMSVYVQRDPDDGATGIDFSMRDLKALRPSHFLYRDAQGRVQEGTEPDLVAAADC